MRTGRLARMPRPTRAAARRRRLRPPASDAPFTPAVCWCAVLQGYKQYDPRVVHLLMDLAYRTTSDILRDAEVGVAAS